MDAPRTVLRRAWIRPIVVTVAFLGAGTTVAWFFLGTSAGQGLDASTFAAVVNLRDELGAWPGRLRWLLPAASAVLLAIAAVAAFLRRAWRAVVPAAALPVVTLVASTVLKDVIARPSLGEHGTPENTFPSGHAAVTIACLIAFLWLMPRGRALMAIPLAMLATASSIFQVVAYAHRLSDVVGGALLAGALAAGFLQRTGGIHAVGRGLIWGVVGIAGAAGTWQLAVWQSAGGSLAGMLGIVLLSGAAATAAIGAGAERASAARSSGGRLRLPDRGVSPSASTDIVVQDDDEPERLADA